MMSLSSGHSKKLFKIRSIIVFRCHVLEYGAFLSIWMFKETTITKWSKLSFSDGNSYFSCVDSIHFGTCICHRMQWCECVSRVSVWGRVCRAITDIDWQQLLCVHLRGHRCRRPASPVRAAPAAAALSGAALLSSARRATAARVSAAHTHSLIRRRRQISAPLLKYWMCGSWFICRSPERYRLSRAGEHARPDLHREQHLRSRWSCGLSNGHS